MGGGGSTDNSQVVYTNLIPTYIPNVTNEAYQYLQESIDLSVGTYSPYNEPTYAPQNANEIAGIAALATRGLSGSGIEADAEAYLRSLLTDGFIGVNPRLDAVFFAEVTDLLQSLIEDILPTIADSYAFAFGGSEHNIEEAKAAEKVMDQINVIARRIYYDDYRTERRIQDAGISHAVPYGQRGMRDAEMLRTAGVYAREYSQGFINDTWKVWNENQIIPVRNLDILGNAIRTILGTSRTANTKFYKPPAFQEIAGVAMSGMSIYSMFKNSSMSPYKNPAGRKPIEDTRGLPDPGGLSDAFTNEWTNRAAPAAPQSVLSGSDSRRMIADSQMPQNPEPVSPQLETEE